MASHWYYFSGILSFGSVIKLKKKNIFTPTFQPTFTSSTRRTNQKSKQRFQPDPLFKNSHNMTFIKQNKKKQIINYLKKSFSKNYSLYATARLIGYPETWYSSNGITHLDFLLLFTHTHLNISILFTKEMIFLLFSVNKLLIHCFLYTMNE